MTRRYAAAPARRGYGAAASRRDFRKPERGHTGDLAGWLMIAGVVVVVLGIMAGMWWLQPKARLAGTGCIKGEPAARRTILVIDRATSLPASEAALLRAAVIAEAADVKIDDRLTVVGFDGRAGFDGGVLLDVCRPASGSDVSSATATPARADRKFAATFAAPLVTALETMPASNAKETHLVAYLGNLVARMRYEANAKEIVIVVFSTMVEHTPTGTLLSSQRKPMTSGEFATYARSIAEERLRGVTLSVRALPPVGGGVKAQQRIRDAWMRAAGELNAHVQWKGL